MIHEVFRTVHAELFAGMPNENQRTFGLWSVRKGSSQSNESHGSGSVVIGTVIDPIRSAGRQRALQIADVVVMSAEGDVGVFQAGIRSFHNPNNVPRVPRVHALIIGLKIEGECDSF